MTLNYKIQNEDLGVTIVSFLSRKYTYYSQVEWIKQVYEKKILVNGLVITQDYRIGAGDEISFDLGEFTEPEVDSNYSIVYEDEYLFAVNKPGNLPVHPAGRYRNGNLTTLLSSSHPNFTFFIVNRIDRETSGLVLFGKTKLAASKLGKLFETGKISKTYLCYVEGNFPEFISANGYLGSDNTSTIRKKKKFTYDKMDSSLWNVNTDLKLLKYQNGISKLEVVPHTGKIHQIRATLYSLGYPVVGDKIYGYDENLFLQFIQNGIVENKYGIQRQALHAHCLDFIHPFMGKQTIIRAEEPLDMENILF